MTDFDSSSSNIRNYHRADENIEEFCQLIFSNEPNYDKALELFKSSISGPFISKLVNFNFISSLEEISGKKFKYTGEPENEDASDEIKFNKLIYRIKALREGNFTLNNELVEIYRKAIEYFHDNDPYMAFIFIILNESLFSELDGNLDSNVWTITIDRSWDKCRDELIKLDLGWVYYYIAIKQNIIDNLYVDVGNIIKDKNSITENSVSKWYLKAYQNGFRDFDEDDSQLIRLDYLFQLMEQGDSEIMD